MQLSFYSVNEDECPYAENRTLEAALTDLEKYPNDHIVVVVTGGPLDREMLREMGADKH